jgi:hypothetical protein
MRYTVRLLPVFLVVALLPSPASAWGFRGHRLIMSRAIDLLPPELKPLFAANRDEIIVRVVDPDMWRTAGWPENPNHFLDFGVKEFGPYPFKELPREYDQAVQKFGRPLLERYGLLPWREAEIFGQLRRAFEGFARRSTYAAQDTVYFSAIIAHYVQDSHQPFHANENYDGQLTGQRGLHSRFEDQLIERFESRLALKPAAPVAIRNPRDSAFDILLESYQLVDPILKADKAASAGKDVYDDDYYEKFFASVRPILERRLSESITATAAVIIGAWEEAGRPTVQVRAARSVEKVSR